LPAANTYSFKLVLPGKFHDRQPTEVGPIEILTHSFGLRFIRCRHDWWRIRYHRNNNATTDTPSDNIIEVEPLDMVQAEQRFSSPRRRTCPPSRPASCPPPQTDTGESSTYVSRGGADSSSAQKSPGIRPPPTHYLADKVTWHPSLATVLTRVPPRNPSPHSNTVLMRPHTGAPSANKKHQGYDICSEILHYCCCDIDDDYGICYGICVFCCWGSILSSVQEAFYW